MSPSAFAPRAAHPSDRTRTPTLAVLGRIGWSVLSWPSRAYEHRRLLHAMAGMSDHELSDVGLARQDLLDAVTLPITGEVGSFLAARSAERRHLDA